jgi:hypothetical protein
MMRPCRMHGGPGADGGGHTGRPAQSATADTVAPRHGGVDGSGPDASGEAYLVRIVPCASLRRHSEYEREAVRNTFGVESDSLVRGALS